MGNSIKTNLSEILKSISPGVKLVVVSKNHPTETIMQAYEAGQRIFGENRVQELTAKQLVLPSDIQWHLIGHLQTNKVKYIAPYVSAIHSVDSIKLLKEINREAIKNKRVIPCLLQIYIADEETKFGFSERELTDALNENPPKDFPGVNFSGLMGMATFTDDNEKIRREFRTLKTIFGKIKSEYFADNNSFSEISMGMSGDYGIAIEEGSTMVRIGSLIFGSRY